MGNCCMYQLYVLVVCTNCMYFTSCLYKNLLYLLVLGTNCMYSLLLVFTNYWLYVLVTSCMNQL